MATVIRPSGINLTPIERIVRVVAGTGGVAGAIVWLALVPSLLVGVGALALAAAGLDLVVTGARGHCPLYAWLARRRARRLAP
ncbi:MAG: YgaP-like transmembrane domain [Dehalococcoidia bacterium]